MLWLFRKVVDRLKALLVADAALDLEAEFLARHADRKAELLRKADEHAEQGLADVAEELRAQSTGLSVERPLASVVPVIGDSADATTEAERPKLEGSSNARQALTIANGKAGKTPKPKATRKTRRR